jgi:catechol 2,3-dioxygenase-like lactoylglutathione lyase family enzyme
MRLHHLAVFASDPARLAAFYTRLLRAEPVRRHEDAEGLRSAWFDLEGSILMVERGTPVGGWVVVFAAGEIGAASWHGRVVAAGGTPDGRSEFTAYGRDPEGNRLGFSSYPRPLGPG